MMTEASGDKLLMMITACLEFVTIIVRFLRNVLLLEIIVQSSTLYGWLFLISLFLIIWMLLVVRDYTYSLTLLIRVLCVYIYK